MRILSLTLSIFFSFQISAQVYTQSSCPYFITDEDSDDILSNLGSTISNELQRIQQNLDNEKNNCILPPVEEVAKAESLISALAQSMVPPSTSFESLFLASQPIACTSTQAGFNEIMKTYINYSTASFEELPSDISDLTSYLDFSGASGEEINQNFYDCHSNSIAQESNDLDVFTECVENRIFGDESNTKNTIAFQVWNKNCGNDLSQSSNKIQELLNKGTDEALKKQTVEELVTASYGHISNTIDSLLKVDPSCKVSSQLSNMANSLMTAGVGLGQSMGTPWVGLALNLVAKPISTLINRWAQNKDRKHKRDLENIYNQINNEEDTRNNKFLCSMISMQKLKCDTLDYYKETTTSNSCSKNAEKLHQESSIKSLTNLVKGLEKNIFLPSNLEETEITKDNALNSLTDENLTHLDQLNSLLLSPIKGLKTLDQSNANNSLKDYLFDTDGIINQLDPNLVTNFKDKLKLKNEIRKAKEFKEVLNSFQQNMQKLESSTSDLDAQTVADTLNDYKSINLFFNDQAIQESTQNTQPQPNNTQPSIASSRSIGIIPEAQPSGSFITTESNTANLPMGTPEPPKQVHSKVNLPYLMKSFFLQKIKTDDNKSDLYKYANREMSVLAENAMSKIGVSNTKGLKTSARFKNTKNYFDFMSSSYVSDQILSKIVEDIDSSPSASSNINDRAIHFDSKVLPAVMNCLFLYQPIVSSNQKHNSPNSLKETFDNKCNFVYKCKEKLGFTLDTSIDKNLNETTEFATYKPICDTSQNIGFIFSKARENFLQTGNVCPK